MENLISCLIFAVCLVHFRPVRGQEKNDGNSSAGETISKFKYPGRIHPVFVISSKSAGIENPTETNHVGNGEDDGPTYYVLSGFQTPGEFLRPPSPPPSFPSPHLPSFPDEKETEPLVKSRRKRDTEPIPETTLIGKIRRKRTHCRKCKGGGGYGGGGGYYPQPYYPGGGGFGGGGGYPGGYGGYGGGGRGCKTCGGYGGGGGGGGGYSFSSSSSQSSAGSFGYGRK